jgi:hypothetical protein
MLPFAAALALHIVLCRAWRAASLWRVLGGPLAAGALLCALWLWRRQVGGPEPGWLADAMATAAVYCALTYAYAELYTLNRTSVRLQALRFVRLKGGAARREELVRACGHETTVDQRLDQYLQTGDLVLIDGRYRIARRRIPRVVRAYRLARRLLLGARPDST